MDLPKLHKEDPGKGVCKLSYFLNRGMGLRSSRVLSQDCNWNAVTLAHPVSPEGLAAFAAQLQAAGAQVRCFDIPNKGVLMVSWRRPDAQVS